MKRAILAVGTATAILSSLLLPFTARAADESKALNLVTSPLPISLVADPGKSVGADLRVKQGSGDTEHLKVTLMKFSAYGSEGKPGLYDRAPGDDYFDWVKFDKTDFMAPNNVWQTVHMTINFPKSAANGYYYAVVFSRYGDDVRRAGNTNSINAGSAVLVLADAYRPDAKRALTLTALTTKHRIYEFLPADFGVQLQNIGNIHIVPHGNIFIMNGKKQIAALDINGEQGNILPSSTRIYPVSWKDGFPFYEPVIEDGKVKLDKNHKQVLHLNWDWTQLPKFRMGQYTAHLFAVYDDGTRDVPLESEVSFWVIPWRFLLILFGAIALIGFGIYAAMRGIWRGAKRARRQS